MEDSIKAFIEEHVKKIKPLYKKRNFAYWTASISGKKEDFDKYESYTKEFTKIYNNKEEFESVKKFNSSGIKDSLLARQIKILYLSYLGAQGDINLLNEIISKESSTQQKFNNFRAKLNGREYTDNEINEVLRKEINSDVLKSLWGASKAQGEIVEKDLIELVKLRNKLARGMGFRNFYAMSLEVNEQSEEELDAIFDNLDRLISGEFAKLKSQIDDFLSKRHSIKKSELGPWHYQDLFFQQGPEIYKVNLDKFFEGKDVVEIARKFYQNMGLPIDNILEKSDLYEKPGKSQHAFCIDIDRKGDVRILQNVKNNEKWMDTTLHELGHAAYSKNISRELPFVLVDASHIFVTEAIALFFGRKSRDFNFISEYSGRVESSLSPEIRAMLRLRMLTFSRWVQVMFNFERKLYEDPEQNLNKLWWSLVKRYQLIDFSRDRPDWASKIHFVSSPVYYHNYMLGELFASQLQNYISKNIAKEKTGDYLRNSIFRHGMAYRWGEIIKNATGEGLNPLYFVKQFANN